MELQAGVNRVAGIAKLLPVLLYATLVAGQTTSVTIQVTDTDGQSWNNGTWTATLYSPPGVPSNSYKILGTNTIVPNQTQSGALSSSGGASLTVTPNTSIVPTGTQWQFTFCPEATPTQCPQYSYSITGASYSVSPGPPGLRVSVQNPLTRATAYLDLEITGAGVGSLYYNLASQTLKACQVTVGNTCTTWIQIGNGVYTFFGNTTNPLTTLVDPTTIIDVAGNELAFTSTGITTQDLNGNHCTLSTASGVLCSDSTSGFGDTLQLHNGSAVLLDGLVDGFEAVEGTGAVMLDNAGDTLTLHSGTLVLNGTASTTLGGSLSIGGSFTMSHLLCSNTAPTIQSGFGTGASITFNNGTCAFIISVGTSPGSNGVLNMPTANTEWVCWARNGINITNITVQVSTSNNSAGFSNYNSSGTLTNWAASTTLVVSCFGL
jgi:hypothetical protein